MLVRRVLETKRQEWDPNFHASTRYRTAIEKGFRIQGVYNLQIQAC